jgi:hypothetical protein
VNVNEVRVAKELARVARLLFAKYGHTLWVTPDGKVIDLGNTDMHYNWIAKNFAKLFPDETFSKDAVFDVPHDRGWIHVRNHVMGLHHEVFISGIKQAIERNSDVLGDIVSESWASMRKEGQKLWVMVSFHDAHRDVYQLPDDYERVKDLISI